MSSSHDPSEKSARVPGPMVTVTAAVLDLEGRIIAVNPAWEAFARRNGGRVEDIGVGISYLDVCASDPDDPSAAEAARTIRAALQGLLPAPARITTKCVSPGTTGWFDMLVSSRMDRDGRVVGASITFSEVGARAAVPAIMPGADLAETDAQGLLSVILACPDAVMVIDGNGWVVLANERCFEVLGLTPEDLVGGAVEETVHLADRDDGWSKDADGRAHRPFRFARGACSHPDGSTFDVEASRLPLVVPPGLSLVTVRAR